MISVNDFRTGLTIEVDGGIWRVLEFQHVKPGKGAAFVRSKLRNLRTGNIQEKTFRAGEKVAKAQIDNRKMQYLYASGDSHVFMDTETYEQVELSSKQVEYELNFLKENMEESSNPIHFDSFVTFCMQPISECIEKAVGFGIDEMKREEEYQSCRHQRSSY